MVVAASAVAVEAVVPVVAAMVAVEKATPCFLLLVDCHWRCWSMAEC